MTRSKYRFSNVKPSESIPPCGVAVLGARSWDLEGWYCFYNFISEEYAQLTLKIEVFQRFPKHFFIYRTRNVKKLSRFEDVGCSAEGER